MMKRGFLHIALVGCLILMGWAARAQQDIMYTQYMFNGMAINPAYAGSHGAISSTLLYRQQWAGIEGAPTTQTFAAHAPLPITKMGAGLLVTNDQIGITRETIVQGAYSYTLPLPIPSVPLFSDAKLALGLSAGMSLYNNNYNDLSLDDLTDGQFALGNINASSPNFGGGAYFYGEQFYLGVSMPRILQNEISQDGVIAYRQERHYFITGGYVFPISPNLKIKPNFLVKTVSGAPAAIDLNANVLFVDRLWLGISYRSFESIDFIGQFNITEQLRVGYAYDASTTAIKEYTNGSHELMLNYLFSFKVYNMKSPRYF